MSASVQLRGRPRQIELDDIMRAGRSMGMARLSVKGVAAQLGVSSTALYRHVDGRWGLERLVGESLLSELQLVDDPAHDPLRHLLSFALQLRAFVLEHPGMAGYLQTLFPRGEGGRRLLAAEKESLQRRGYAPDAAIALASAVAGIAIGYTAAEDAQRDRVEGLDAQRDDAMAALLADAALGDARRALPEVDADEYARLWMTAAISGCVAAMPPGLPVPETVAALRAAGEGV